MGNGAFPHGGSIMELEEKQKKGYVYAYSRAKRIRKGMISGPIWMT